tara:strand:+ start:1779 stop:2186 length:408 start_codon:yes stop_codon:yes gene_type:complete
MYSQIYLVDDEEIVNFIHRVSIRELGVENKVINFTNPEKALDHVRYRIATTEPILILLDINMPEMTGFEFLEFMVLEEFPTNIDVAIVTSSVSEADKNLAKEFSQFVKGFVSKPINSEQMQELIGEPAQQISHNQ